MQYSPKLKRVMEQVKVILKKEGIGGAVVLHVPGHSEFLFHVQTPYSCAKFVGDDLQLKTDPLAPKEKKHQQVIDTANLFTHLADVCGRLSLNAFQVNDMLRERFPDMFDTDGEFTTDTQQNN